MSLSFCTNSLAIRTARIEVYEPGQNVSLWLPQLNTERLLRSWHDNVAVAETSLLLGDIPLTWLINNCNDNTTWKELKSGIKQRFGESEQIILVSVRHRKQQENETVQTYIDEMSMLLSQSSIPEAMKQDLMLENMKPDLRKQVTATIPKSLQDIITNASLKKRRVALA